MLQVVNDHLRLELTAPCFAERRPHNDCEALQALCAGQVLHCFCRIFFQVQSKHMPHHSVRADMVAMYVVQRDVQASSDFQHKPIGKTLSASLMRRFWTKRNSHCFLLFSRQI